MKKLLQKKHKGMFTVEAVLIVPIMMLAILGLIYLSIMQYQNVVAVAEATRSANRVAANWSYIGGSNPPALNDESSASEMITEDMYTDRSPYRYIVETGSAVAGTFGVGARQANGQKYTNSRISSLKFNKYTTGTTDAKPKTEVGFLSSYVTVSIKKGYKNPLGSMLEIIGIRSSQSNEREAKSLITSPSEFIRNIDSIFQLGYFLMGQ